MEDDASLRYPNRLFPNSTLQVHKEIQRTAGVPSFNVFEAKVKSLNLMLNKLISASDGHVYHMPLFPLPLWFSPAVASTCTPAAFLRMAFVTNSLTKMLLDSPANCNSCFSPQWNSCPIVPYHLCGFLPAHICSHLAPQSQQFSLLFPELQEHGQQSLQCLRAGLDEGVTIDYFYLTEETYVQVGKKAYFI